MPKKIIFKVILLSLLIPLIPTENLLYASQVELTYYSKRTLDTVTPEGIYSQVIIQLSAAKGVMDNIRYVTYQLEDPFYRKSVVVRSQAHNFQLEVNAITHFHVAAQVHFSDGKNLTLNQYIILGIQKPPLTPAHQVSISHEVLDAPSKTNQGGTYSVSLFLEGTPTELAQISKVEYYFPKSFSRAPITIKGPSSNFQLHVELSQQSSIQAYIYFKDGTVSQRVRFIYFKYY
jgi:hypothetical protein